MPNLHRPIPILPARPRVHPIADHVCRSYPVGRQNFARISQGGSFPVSIATDNPLPPDVRARLVTTLNSDPAHGLAEIPLKRSNDRTLSSAITPVTPGLHAFRAEFSLDGGSIWQGDTVADSWVLVDTQNTDDLRMYTLIPTVSGTLSDWAADLKRISGMGFNAVHLLPITALDTSESPYSARDLFDIDHSYLADGAGGGLDQVAAFVDEAKALGIRLCFDLVLNHVGVHSAMAGRAPDWIVPDDNEPDGLRRARYWTGYGWSVWSDLVLINYEHPSDEIRAEICSYMTDYALFWAKFANDTGGFVRLDNLHGSDADFIEKVATAIHSEYPAVGILAEYFTDDGTLLQNIPRWGLNLILATPWNYKFVPQLREYLGYIHRNAGAIRYLMPITSHDSGSPAQEFGTAESTVPRYVAAALLGTGATGLTQGVEYGENERIDFIGRKPRIQYAPEARFAEFISRVNGILTEYPAFRLPGNCRFVDCGHPAIIAAFRHDIGTEDVGFLVACNFDTGSEQVIQVDLASVLGEDVRLTCSDLLSGEARIYPQARLELRLLPCAAQVLRIQRDMPPAE